MYKVRIDESSLNIQLLPDTVSVDNELLSWDLIAINDHLYHLITDSNSYSIEVMTADRQQKKIQLKVNGVILDMVVQDKYDLLLEKLGMNQSDDSNHQAVLAPMPGMILDILVKEGQAVSKGEKLIILEAMKMENIIKSTGNGTIEAINIQKGTNVEKNQVLIQF